MSDQGVVCESRRTKWGMFIFRFNRWSWWYTSKVAWFICKRVKKYENPPLRNRWLAGLSVACWTHVCGHDLKYAFHIGMIYWCPKNKPSAEEGA